MRSLSAHEGVGESTSQEGGGKDSTKFIVRLHKKMMRHQQESIDRTRVNKLHSKEKTSQLTPLKDKGKLLPPVGKK